MHSILPQCLSLTTIPVVMLLFLLNSCDSTIHIRESNNYLGIYNDDNDVSYTWSEALAYCDLEFDTDLASIHSLSDENDVIYSRSSIETETWIGLTDLDSENIWEWSDGTPYNYNITWRPGEPNNDNSGEDCTLLDSDDNFLANDVSCTRGHHQFVCNKPDTYTPTSIPTPGPTNTPTTTNGGNNGNNDEPMSTWINDNNNGSYSSFTTSSSDDVNGKHGSDSNSKDSKDSSEEDISKSDLYIPFIIVCVLCGLLCCVIIFGIFYYLRWKQKIEEIEDGKTRRKIRMFETLNKGKVHIDIAGLEKEDDDENDNDDNLKDPQNNGKGNKSKVSGKSTKKVGKASYSRANDHEVEPDIDSDSN